MINGFIHQTVSLGKIAENFPSAAITEAYGRKTMRLTSKRRTFMIKVQTSSGKPGITELIGLVLLPKRRKLSVSFAKMLIKERKICTWLSSFACYRYVFQQFVWLLQHWGINKSWKLRRTVLYNTLDIRSDLWNHCFWGCVLFTMSAKFLEVTFEYPSYISPHLVRAINYLQYV